MKLDEIFKMAISDFPKNVFFALKISKNYSFWTNDHKIQNFQNFQKPENMLKSPISTSGVPNFSFLAF